MGLYTGGLIIGRILAPEIWGSYFREGLFIYLLIYLFIYFILFIFSFNFFFRGGGGLLSEFYGVTRRSLNSDIKTKLMPSDVSMVLPSLSR